MTNEPQPTDMITQESAALIGRETVASASRQREITKRHQRKQTDRRLDTLKALRPSTT